MAIYDISGPLYTSSTNPPGITCTWNHPDLGPIPFTAMPNDVVPYGVEIYNQLVAGDYGTVLSYEQSHFYSTVDGNVYNGMTYNTGAEMVCPDGVQPANSTPDVPPLLGYGVPGSAYWYNDAWVVSYFDPGVYTTLGDAQAYLKTQTAGVGANAVNYQLRGYSDVQIRTAPDITALITFDYAPMTIGDYQTFIDGQVAARDAIVDGAATLEDLFTFNPEDLDTVP